MRSAGGSNVRKTIRKSFAEVCACELIGRAPSPKRSQVRTYVRTYMRTFWSVERCMNGRRKCVKIIYIFSLSSYVRMFAGDLATHGFSRVLCVARLARARMRTFGVRLAPSVPHVFPTLPRARLSGLAQSREKSTELFSWAAINILVDRQVRCTDACRTAEPDPNLVTRARCRPERRVSASAPEVDQLRPLQPEPAEGRIWADLANPKNMRRFLPKWPFSEGRGKESGC